GRTRRWRRRRLRRFTLVELDRHRFLNRDLRHLAVVHQQADRLAVGADEHPPDDLARAGTDAGSPEREPPRYDEHRGNPPGTCAAHVRLLVYFWTTGSAAEIWRSISSRSWCSTWRKRSAVFGVSAVLTRS